MILVVRLARDFNQTEIEALIPGKRILGTDWTKDGDFAIQTDLNLSAAEKDAITRRLETRTQVEEDLYDRAVGAYKSLQDFEALASPTNLQTVTVVKLLCKVVRGLIRLQLRRLDTAD